MGYNKNRGLNFGLVMPKSKKIIWVYFISVTIPLLPFISLGAGDLKKEYAAAAVSTRDLLNPDKWFEVLKRNITIPISKEQVIKIPTPEESLKQSAPKLKEIGRGVKDTLKNQPAQNSAERRRFSRKQRANFTKSVLDLFQKSIRLP